MEQLKINDHKQARFSNNGHNTMYTLPNVWFNRTVSCMNRLLLHSVVWWCLILVAGRL